jgi:hypothetical protein
VHENIRMADISVNEKPKAHLDININSNIFI